MGGKKGKRGKEFGSNLLLTLILTTFLFTLAVVIVLNSRWLYYMDITLLGLEKETGMSRADIRANYDALIRYNQFWYQGELKFPTLIMSETGQIHFQEVKRIFVVIQYACIVSGVLSLIGVVRHAKRRSWSYQKMTGILALGLPIVLGVLVAMNWETFFVTFHHIFFKNNYWLFDSSTDPVILILPDTYFLHCAVLILVLILGESAICLARHHHHKRAQVYVGGKRLGSYRRR